MSAPVACEFPLPIVEWTHGARLQPTADAVKVEGVIALAPRDCALVRRGAGGVCLTLDTLVHDVVATDGAIVHLNVPGPQRHRVPLHSFDWILRPRTDCTFFTSNRFLPCGASLVCCDCYSCYYYCYYYCAELSSSTSIWLELISLSPGRKKRTHERTKKLFWQRMPAATVTADACHYLLALDFDWTMIECDSDRWVVQSLLGSQHWQALAGQSGSQWTDVMDRYMQLIWEQ